MLHSILVNKFTLTSGLTLNERINTRSIINQQIDPKTRKRRFTSPLAIKYPKNVNRGYEEALSELTTKEVNYFRLLLCATLSHRSLSNRLRKLTMMQRLHAKPRNISMTPRGEKIQVLEYNRNYYYQNGTIVTINKIWLR